MALNLTNEEIKLFIERITGNKDFLYIIQPYSIASVIISGGLSHAVQARKNKIAAVLIVGDVIKNLGLTWKNIADIKYFPSDMMSMIDKYFIETQEWEGENYIYGNFHQEIKKTDENSDSDKSEPPSDDDTAKVKNDVEKVDDKDSDANNMFLEKLTLIDQFKQKVFDLPLDTEFVYPSFEKISDDNAAALNEKYILDKDRTIIFCPYFDFMPITNIIFWNDVVKSLKGKGYRFYTYVQSRRQITLEGTLPLKVDFAELKYISDKIKCFVGIRNGTFDFLAMTDAKIFCVDAFPSWNQDLNIVYPNCHARTFYDTTGIIRAIRNFLADSNTGAKFTLHHEKINDADIFYTQKSILNALTDAVQKD